MKKHIAKHPYLLSLLLHSCLLAAAVCTFTNTKPKYHLGKNVVAFVNVFVSTPANQPKVTELMPLKTALNTKIASKSTVVSVTQSTNKTSARQGDKLSALISLLHNAIQAQQHYPLIALQEGRSGVVTVTFMLYPDGSIQDLTVLQSSGENSLDTAALSAVNEAAPFAAVKPYLQTPQHFSVDVVFQS